MRSFRGLRMRLGRTAGVLLIAALTVSCGGGEADPAQSATATAGTDTEVPSPTPSSERVLLFGTAECAWTTGPSETQEGKATVDRGTLTCTETMSDPRVSGEDVIELTETKVANPDIARFVCETATLTTGGGTWRGDCYGSEYWDEKGGLYTNGHATYTGEGAYAGLVYHALFTQSPETAGYIYVGYIEPAE